MTYSLTYQIYFYSILKLKELIRMNKLKIIFLLTGLIYISFSYGIILVSLFNNGIANFFSSSSTSSASEFIALDFSGLFFRDLLVNGILLLYLTFLSVNLLRSITGVSNPFINNHYDANFQQLIPINPYVSYLSCKINGLVRNLILTLIAGLLIFSPLIFILKISYFVIIPILLNYFLGFELISLIGNIVFFLFKPLRSDKDWAIIFADKSNIVVSGSTVIIPLLFVALANQKSLLTFQLLQKYSFLPFINIAIANTGFLFRSGIPFSAYIGLGSLVIQIVLLEMVILILIKFISTSSELGDLLPILEFLDSKQIDNLLVNDENFLQISVDKVDRNTKFMKGEENKSLLKKDLLLINRSNDFRFNIFLIFFLSILSTIFFILGINQNSDFIYAFMITFFALITLELDSIIKIFYSISLNSKLLFSDSLQNYLIKGVFGLIFFIPILIIFIFKINLVLILMFVVLIMIGDVLNRFNIRNYFIILFLGLSLGAFFLRILL